jgi:hypothetical protein
MDLARETSPLAIAILAEAPGWNQVAPPIVQGPPCHGVLNYNNTPLDNVAGEDIEDHYIPFFKVLMTGWNINYVLQPIVSFIPPPPAPTLPPNPTVPQESNWLSQLPGWLQNILNRFGKIKVAAINHKTIKQ